MIHYFETLGLWPLQVLLKAETPGQLKGKAREAIMKRRLSAFKHIQMSTALHLPQTAALAVAEEFPGASSSLHIIDAVPEIDGFHRRDNPELYHADSVSFEDAFYPLSRDSRSLMQDMMDQGVNPQEALSVAPGNLPCYVQLTGSVVDFWHLLKAFAPAANEAHPAARKGVKAVWSEIRDKYPAIAEAFEEVSP